MLPHLLAVMLSAAPCALPTGATVEAHLAQLLPNAPRASGEVEASSELRALFARARRLRAAGNTRAAVLATLTKRLDLLEEFATLCTEQAGERLLAVRMMTALTVVACEASRFPECARAIAVARQLAKDVPASAAAHQALASALDVAERWAPTPERSWALGREKTLALENCHELDPSAPCTPGADAFSVSR